MSWPGSRPRSTGSSPLTQFPALADPDALHLIALHHNWDGDNGVPRVVSEHPLLDQGTALMLFWLSEPPEVAVGVGGEPEGDPQPLTDLIDTLRARLLADDFVSRAIAVDPREDLGFNRLFVERLRRAGVAPVLWRRSPGVPFDKPAVIDRARDAET